MKRSKDKRLVLASGSPRRRELMAALNAPVKIVPPRNVDERPVKGEAPEDLVTRLSLDKAQKVADQVGSSIVLGADTAVVLDGHIFGKPSDHDEATWMLDQLRGRTHRVITAVTGLDAETFSRLTLTNSTDVTMRPYSDDEVAEYVASGEPMDKAGAYAIQDPAFHPTESVRGCYLNVVGLPLCEVVPLLKRMGYGARLRRGWQPPEQCNDCPLRRGWGVVEA